MLKAQLERNMDLLGPEDSELNMIALLDVILAKHIGYDMKQNKKYLFASPLQNNYHSEPFPEFMGLRRADSLLQALNALAGQELFKSYG